MGKIEIKQRIASSQCKVDEILKRASINSLMDRRYQNYETGCSNNMQRTKNENGTYDSRQERNKFEQRDVKEDQEIGVQSYQLNRSSRKNRKNGDKNRN